MGKKPTTSNIKIPLWSTLLNIVLLMAIVFLIMVMNNRYLADMEIYKTEESEIIITIMDTIALFSDDIEDLGEFERTLVSQLDQLNSIKAVLYNDNFEPLTHVSPTSDGRPFIITDYPDIIEATENGESGWLTTYINGFKGKTYFHWVTLANGSEDVMILYSIGDRRFMDDMVTILGSVIMLMIFLIVIKTQFIDGMIFTKILKHVTTTMNK